MEWEPRDSRHRARSTAASESTRSRWERSHASTPPKAGVGWETCRSQTGRSWTTRRTSRTRKEPTDRPRWDTKHVLSKKKKNKGSSSASFSFCYRLFTAIHPDNARPETREGSCLHATMHPRACVRVGLNHLHVNAQCSTASAGFTALSTSHHIHVRRT